MQKKNANRNNNDILPAFKNLSMVFIFTTPVTCASCGVNICTDITITVHEVRSLSELTDIYAAVKHSPR